MSDNPIKCETRPPHPRSDLQNDRVVAGFFDGHRDLQAGFILRPFQFSLEARSSTFATLPDDASDLMTVSRSGQPITKA